MSFTEKVDVLDMIIQVLKDHEKKLDEISRRIEAALENKDFRDRWK